MAERIGANRQAPLQRARPFLATVALAKAAGRACRDQPRPVRGRPIPGLEYERFFSKEGVDPFDEVEWDLRSAVIGSEKGEVVFEQRDVEIPQVLVPAGHQHRRLQVLPRADRHAGARAQRQAADRPRRRHHHRMGHQAEVLRDRRGPLGVLGRPEAPARLSEGRVQLAGLVQRRLREGAAVLRLLHQLRAGHDGVDPRPGEDRGDAVQVRIGHRVQPVEYPLVQGAPRRRRDRVGSRVVHEGLRRVRRGHQVGRQDAPRGQDGHPQRRASRHRRVHQLQGRGREEGLGADRRRLRRLVHGRRLRVGLLPELQQLRPRDRRVHARGAGRRRVDDQGGA